MNLYFTIYGACLMALGFSLFVGLQNDSTSQWGLKISMLLGAIILWSAGLYLFAVSLAVLS